VCPFFKPIPLADTIRQMNRGQIPTIQNANDWERIKNLLVGEYSYPKFQLSTQQPYFRRPRGAQVRNWPHLRNR